MQFGINIHVQLQTIKEKKYNIFAKKCEVITTRVENKNLEIQ